MVFNPIFECSKTTALAQPKTVSLQTLGDTAAHEADASQIAIALDFFMKELRWGKLFKGFYGNSVEDVMADTEWFS